MWVMFVQIGRSTSGLECFINCSKRLWPLSCNVIGPMYLVWSTKGLDSLVLCKTFCGGSHSKCSLMPPWWIQACQQLDALRKNILHMPGIVDLVDCPGSCGSSSSASRSTRSSPWMSRSQSWSCSASSPALCSTGNGQPRGKRPRAPLCQSLTIMSL